MWYVYEVVYVEEAKQNVSTRYPQGFETEQKAEEFVTRRRKLPAYADSKFLIADEEG